MAKVSVIIVSWNARDYLKTCLASIRQTGAGVVQEVIVVDNGSSDGSPEMVVAEFSDVHLIRSTENLGFARGNNLGMQHAAGEYFALINSDIVVHPGCLQSLEEFLDTHPSVALVGPRATGGDGRLQHTCRKLPTVWNTFCEAVTLHRLFPSVPCLAGREMLHWDHDTEESVEVLSGCFWMVRRKVVEQVGGLDERFFFYAEDVDWCKRFRDAGWKVMLAPKATTTHFGGVSSANKPFRYSIELHRANLAYWRKHYGPIGMAVYHALSVIHHTVRLALRGAELNFRDRDQDVAHKFERSRLCLRWLLLGKGL